MVHIYYISQRLVLGANTNYEFNLVVASSKIWLSSKGSKKFSKAIEGICENVS